MRRALRTFFAALCLLIAGLGAAASRGADALRPAVPILVYHRFGPTVTDPMTVTTAVFEQHLAWLRAHDYRILPLRVLVDSLGDPARAVPPRAVVITVDDGHESVYGELLPLVRRDRFPVTLFVYPSAISNADYALTWQQLAAMVDTGLIDVQSHSYWHPNFHRERARLSADAYRALVMTQLTKSRDVIGRRLGGRADLLAWPFGIHDPELERWAREAGYVAAFTIERRAARRGDDPLALPRYLMTDRDRGARFAAIVAGADQRSGRP